VILGRAPASATRRTVREALAEASGEGAHGQQRPADPLMVAGLLLGSPDFQKQ
jgi:hypothetical protein